MLILEGCWDEHLRRLGRMMGLHRMCNICENTWGVEVDIVIHELVLCQV